MSRDNRQAHLDQACLPMIKTPVAVRQADFDQIRAESPHDTGGEVERLLLSAARQMTPWFDGADAYRFVPDSGD